MAITPVGFEGQVNEQPFAKMMAAVGSYGILGTYNGTDFAVTGVAGQRNVLVQGQPSSLWAPGVHVTMDADASPTGASLNSSGLPRIDMVVMRVNWTTDACALSIVEGTPDANPVAPTNYNKTPGTVFDVPLAEMTLPHNAGQYQSVRDRRVWLQDGLMIQPDDRVLPDATTGRLVGLPDSGTLVFAGAGGRWLFDAERDTSWVTVPITTPGGFSGSVKGRIRNKIAALQFNWTKTGGTITNTDFAVTFPATWWPSGIDISRGIFAANSPVRVYFSAGNGQMEFNNVTISPGNILNGGFSYFVN